MPTRLSSTSTPRAAATRTARRRRAARHLWIAAWLAPVLLLGPAAGIVADRYPRRTVMIVADLVRAVLVFVLVVSHTSTVTAFAVAFGLSTGSLLFNPAAASLVPDVVVDDDLVTANSALWTTAVASQIALAPLAVAVIAAFGVDDDNAGNSLVRKGRHQPEYPPSTVTEQQHLATTIALDEMIDRDAYVCDRTVVQREIIGSSWAISNAREVKP